MSSEQLILSTKEYTIGGLVYFLIWLLKANRPKNSILYKLGINVLTRKRCKIETRCQLEKNWPSHLIETQSKKSWKRYKKRRPVNDHWRAGGRSRNGLDPKLLKARKRDSRLKTRFGCELKKERETKIEKESVSRHETFPIEDWRSSLQQETRPVEACLLH